VGFCSAFPLFEWTSHFLYWPLDQLVQSHAFNNAVTNMDAPLHAAFKSMSSSSYSFHEAMAVLA